MASDCGAFRDWSLGGSDHDHRGELYRQGREFCEPLVDSRWDVDLLPDLFIVHIDRRQPSGCLLFVGYVLLVLPFAFCLLSFECFSYFRFASLLV